MARFSVSSTFALTTATAKTVIRINSPASRKAILRKIVIVDSLAASTDAGIILRVLTGGTDGTGTANTPVPLNGTSACVSTAKITYTAEPTGTTEVYKSAVPAGGGIEVAFDGEEGIQVPHSSGFGLELTAAQARAAGIVAATLIFEE